MPGVRIRCGAKLTLPLSKYTTFSGPKWAVRAPMPANWSLAEKFNPSCAACPCIADIGQDVPYRGLGSGDVAFIKRQGYTTVDGVELPRLQLLFGSDQTRIGFRWRRPKVAEGDTGSGGS